jgi:Prismane/CO dehydrogenase family
MCTTEPAHPPVVSPLLLVPCPSLAHTGAPQAVAVLLTLLHLNLKNIYLGPNLPAFVTPNMLQILVDTYGVRGINAADYQADLKQMIAGN